MKNGNNRTMQRHQRNSVPQFEAFKRGITGHEYTPAPDPTTIVDRPFNHLTLEFTNYNEQGFPVSKTVDVTVQDAIQAIQQKVDLATTGVRFKVVKATAYVTSCGPAFLKPTAEFSVYELRQASSATARCTMLDSGDLNTPAKAGYHWPLVDKKEILTSADNATKIATLVGPEQTTGTGSSAVRTHAGMLLRLYVLWK